MAFEMNNRTKILAAVVVLAAAGAGAWLFLFDDDAGVRENRLKLLNEIRAATRAVADFSKIQD